MPPDVPLPPAALAESSPAPATIVVPDPLRGFAEHLGTLPVRDVRRLGLMLAQLGLLITVASLGISIVGMNIGLTTGLVGCLVARAPLHRCVGAWWYLALVVLLGLSLAQAWETKELIAIGVIPLGLLVAQVAYHPLMPHAERIRRWSLWLLFATIAIGTLVALGQFFIGRGTNKPFQIDPHGRSFHRASGLLGVHLTQGMVMGTLACLTLGLFATMRPVLRFSSAGLAMISVAICGSRAALVGFIGAISAYLLARGKQSLVIFVATVAGLSCAVLVLMALIWPHRFQRMTALEDGRWLIWRASLQLAVEHPIVGVGGKGQFRAAYPEAYARVNPGKPSEFPNGAPHAHNTQLAHAAEYGVPYALCWLIMLAVSVWHLRRAPRPILQAGVGMAAMAVFFGQFEKLDGESQRALWTGLGMLLALRAAAPPAEPEAIAQQPGRS